MEDLYAMEALGRLSHNMGLVTQFGSKVILTKQKLMKKFNRNSVN